MQFEKASERSNSAETKKGSVVQLHVVEELRQHNGKLHLHVKSSSSRIFLVLEDSAPEPPHVIDQSPAANFVDRKSAGILEACAYTARCSSPIDPEITIHNRDRFLVLSRQ